MRGIAVKCPECNAALEVSVEAQEARCTYCGTLTLIQRRTRLLQRPRPLPERPAAAPAARVATEPRRASGVGLLIGVVGIPVLLCAGLPLLLCNLDWSTPYGTSVLADVDGDGADDLISVMRERESQAMFLSAFEGQGGGRIWRSAELRSGTDIGILCVAGAVLIEGDKGASLKGINLADGELRWQVRLEEAVERLCTGDDASTVRVVRKDKRAHLLSLADGKLRPAASSAACGPLRCDRPFGREGRRLGHHEQQRLQAALPGMKVERVIERSGATLALGHKAPGTSVPMIAAVRLPGAGDGEAGAPKVLWSAVVPASTPLAVERGAPDPNDVGLSDEAVAVAFELNDHSTNRLTVFSRADGRRRFDVQLPEALRGIWAVLFTGQRVIVTSTWGITTALDVQSGEEVYTID